MFKADVNFAPDSEQNQNNFEWICGSRKATAAHLMISSKLAAIMKI